MLPDQPWLVACPHCSILVWITELEELGQLDPGFRPFLDGPSACNSHAGGSALLKDARPFRLPTMKDFFDVLGSGLTDPKKIRYARNRAWWAANDQRRRQTKSAPMSLQEIENLEGLAAILDDTESSEKIMKAEIMRELGRFDEALELLAGNTDPESAQAVAAIGRLAEAGDRMVRELIAD